MTILFTGPRDWLDIDSVTNTLNELKPSVIIHGCARGLDSIVSKQYGLLFKDGIIHRHPANWNKFGRSAGPIRNKEMLDSHSPGLVVAFKYKDRELTKGTGNMVSIAKRAKVPVKIVEA